MICPSYCLWRGSRSSARAPVSIEWTPFPISDSVPPMALYNATIGKLRGILADKVMCEIKTESEWHNTQNPLFKHYCYRRILVQRQSPFKVPNLMRVSCWLYEQHYSHGQIFRKKRHAHDSHWGVVVAMVMKLAVLSGNFQCLNVISNPQCWRYTVKVRVC